MKSVHLVDFITKKTHDVVEQVKDSLMFNIFCLLSYNKKVTELSSMTSSSRV